MLSFVTGGSVLGQEASQGATTGDTAEAPTAESFDEEVIVRGMPLGTLRDLIEEAEVALYDRFNEINSNDEFDIFCYSVVDLGSRIPLRRCLPNYWREADRRIGIETARAMQGSSAMNTQMFVSEQMYKTQMLTEEMERLTLEDDELLAAATRLANLHQTLSDSKGMRRAARETTMREVRPENDEIGLYSEAEAVFEVRVGRKPWSHDLTHRTFTIARVYGEIRDLELDCDQRETKLEHETGIEWTLPASWGDCTVVVDAARDTSFALYEFE